MACRILVVAEQERGGPKDIAWELLGLAHRLAKDAGWGADTVKALVVGANLDAAAKALAARGAAEVIAADSPALENYSCDGYDRAIEAQVKAEAPEVVLLGHTPNGWDVAPLVAAGLGAPLLTECSAVTIAGGRPRFTRKAFNGKFVQDVEVGDARPAIATMQRGAAPAFTGTTQGTVRRVDPGIDAAGLQARFVEIRKGESGGLDLSQAAVIVSGGRGLGAAEKFSIIRDLAAALGGQVGASRPVTDSGWLPHEHQIGSSGVTVNPKLYVACGISGAIQHLAGMGTSKVIVALNKDPEAPIFQVATYGIVGDIFQTVPELAKAVRAAKAE
jgi:electron transfer flavoprotein alpha subunit